MRTGTRPQTKHEWDGTGDGGDRDRPQMAGDDANHSQELTGGGITRYRALVPRISNLSQKCAVRWQTHQRLTWNGSRGLEGISWISREQSACLFHWKRSGGLEAYSDEDKGGDKITRRSVSVDVIMRGGHCLKVWTKKKQTVSLSTTGDPERGEGLGQCIWVEPTSGCHRDDVLGQPQRIGQSKTCRHAELGDTRGLRVRKVRHEESGCEREPS